MPNEDLKLWLSPAPPLHHTVILYTFPQFKAMETKALADAEESGEELTKVDGRLRTQCEEISNDLWCGKS